MLVVLEPNPKIVRHTHTGFRQITFDASRESTGFCPQIQVVFRPRIVATERGLLR
jgi:hypothetical protein